jgi:hypothetical protein
LPRDPGDRFVVRRCRKIRRKGVGRHSSCDCRGAQHNDETAHG